MLWSFIWLSRKRAFFFFFLKCLFLWDWASVYLWCLAPFPCYRKSLERTSRLGACPPAPTLRPVTKQVQEVTSLLRLLFWLSLLGTITTKLVLARGPWRFVHPCLFLHTHTEAGQRNTPHPPEDFISPRWREPSVWRWQWLWPSLNYIVWNPNLTRKSTRQLRSLSKSAPFPQGGSVLLGGTTWWLLQWSRQATRSETSSSLLFYSSSLMIASGHTSPMIFLKAAWASIPWETNY